MTLPKIARVANALVFEGRDLTAKQIAAMFGFASTNSARKAVSDLRMVHGYSIYLNRKVDTKGRVKYKYHYGTVSRRVLAAGYRALAAQRAAA
jgi:chromosome segregation and condensation protein ScpB